MVHSSGERTKNTVAPVSLGLTGDIRLDYLYTLGGFGSNWKMRSAV